MEKKSSKLTGTVFILPIVLLMVFAQGCVSHKKIIMFQGEEAIPDTLARQNMHYALQPNDRVVIMVSSYDERVTQFYNLSSGSGGGGTRNPMRNPMQVYWISDEGYVDVPLLEPFYVAGLSVEEARLKIQKKLRQQVPDAYVVVRLANFQVTVMGEVGGGGGVVTTDNGYMTVYQALSNSGGFSLYSKRNDVKIIREYPDSSVVHTVDLTRRDLISSDFYYLQPDDIVYVERTRTRTFLDNASNISRVIGLSAILVLAERLIGIL